MPTYTSDDQVKIAYRVEGSGNNNVLFVHGWMMNGGVYDDVLARINHAELRSVIPDQRGAGDSDKPEGGYTIERYVADLVGLMDEVSSDPFVVVGHSMGGQIAQLLAATAPERVSGLVLLCPVPACGIPLPPEAQGLFRGASTRDPQATILGMACKELNEESTERLLGLGASVSPECIAESFDAWMTGGFADRLGAIQAPTLCVATDDPFLPPEFLTAAVVDPIARARLAVLRGPGHYVQVERPAETAAIIEGFLAGIGHSGGGTSAAS
ncbi:MAG: alpha/beta hydrolase [Myxococcales bacterium]|nr:alpha/beta hydrolase [Myxococcales bacterium]